jgi:beta-fructofuranosidase
MFALPQTDIGDVWPYHDIVSGITHLYFLRAITGTGRHWSIGHLTSKDLIHWEDHGIVLAPGEDGAFDDLGLATGSVIQHDGQYYMAYTAHSKRDEPKAGSIGLARSTDLYHWKKIVTQPIVTLDEQYYESHITGSRPFLHWRDPCLLKQPDGFHMFLCARRLDGPIKTRGTVAHLISDDLLHWKTLPPLQVQPMCEEMECPLVYPINGRFYLLFSTHRDLLDSAVNPNEPVPEGGLFCQVSEALEGPYRARGWGRIDMDHHAGYFYAHQLINRPVDYHLIGTVNPKNQLPYISDPIKVDIRPDRIGVNT